uniref:Uncharacterized protein n=2 Tax=Pinguiococcus pyrenoidosus TaxID=172671 RepID=A0A7R9U6C4_9STRA|mmetsp:Transcript_16538/g.62902  ORF Transcript_16538/g.62902 Transcript_16538/m.62902 type:complete len:152 (+) Transcript_16538:3-458(+)
MASLKVLLLTVILMRCDAYPEMMACDRALEIGGERIMGDVPVAGKERLVVKDSRGEILRDTYPRGDTLELQLSITRARWMAKASATDGEPVFLRSDGKLLSCATSRGTESVQLDTKDVDGDIALWIGYAGGYGPVRVTEKVLLRPSDQDEL